MDSPYDGYVEGIEVAPPRWTRGELDEFSRRYFYHYRPIRNPGAILRRAIAAARPALLVRDMPWGVVLGRYCDSSDVVFGAVVSGRVVGRRARPATSTWSAVPPATWTVAVIVPGQVASKGAPQRATRWFFAATAMSRSETGPRT